MLAVSTEDCEGLMDVWDTVALSVGLGDVLVVLNEVSEVGFEATPVTVTALSLDLKGLFVDVTVPYGLCDVSLV